MEEEKNNVEDLLQAYFERNLSEGENLLVEAWINECDENLRIAQQIDSLCLATSALNLGKKIDVEHALKRIWKKKERRRDISWIIYLQRSAAVLFIPLLFLFGLKYLTVEDIVEESIVEMKTNPGMTTSIVLPDGSLAILNSESILKYPSTFNKGKREVFLEGEAFFEIVENKDQEFIVSTLSDIKIEVHGTKFNVDAYHDKNLVIVTLVEGVVSFKFKEQSNYKKITMKPGQKTIYDGITSKVVLNHTSARSETAWKDGKIIFEKTPFEEALRILEKRYHVEFIINNQRLKDDFFTGEFSSQRLERILEYFKLSSNVHWSYLDTDHEKEERTKIEIY